MSFWSGKKESLNQSLVEITFRAVLSGLVIVFFAQFLIANIAGIRVAGRGGADRSTLAALQEMVMRALR